MAAHVLPLSKIHHRNRNVVDARHFFGDLSLAIERTETMPRATTSICPIVVDWDLVTESRTSKGTMASKGSNDRFSKRNLEVATREIVYYF